MFPLMSDTIRSETSDVTIAMIRSLPRWRAVAREEMASGDPVRMWSGVSARLADAAVAAASGAVIGAWSATVYASFPLRMAMLNRMLVSAPDVAQIWEAEADLVGRVAELWRETAGLTLCPEHPQVTVDVGDGRGVVVSNDGDEVTVLCYNDAGRVSIGIPIDGPIATADDHGRGPE